MKRYFATLLSLISIALSPACTRNQTPSIEDLSTGRLITEFEALELMGRRDGDRLPTRVRFVLVDSVLTLDLVLRIGVPTTLLHGNYEWQRSGETLRGTVRQRSITFLGGQSDNPNLGGVFELLGADGSAAFKIVIPTSQVRPRKGPSH